MAHGGLRGGGVKGRRLRRQTSDKALLQADDALVARDGLQAVQHAAVPGSRQLQLALHLQSRVTRSEQGEEVGLHLQARARHVDGVGDDN
jgi:hypothetical protein